MADPWGKGCGGAFVREDVFLDAMLLSIIHVLDPL